jgi:hypothetical protein
MPTIFDLLYREYCRARLAEMRKQLLVSSAESQEVPKANCDAGDSADAADRSGDRGIATRHEAGHGTKPATARQIEGAKQLPLTGPNHCRGTFENALPAPLQ